MKCPNCNSEIKYENVNVLTDVAQCQECHHVFKVSEALHAGSDPAFDLNQEVKGTWYNKEIDHIVIGVTTRSPIAFFLVPFMLVWSGGSIGGIYGTQIISGEFNPMISLFGIPFIIGSIIFWSLTLMCIWSKVELTLDNQGGTIFTGLGKIGIKRKFTWDEISTIREGHSRFNYPGSNGGELLLEGKKRISFAKGVRASRRYYLMNAVKTVLYKAKMHRSIL